MNKDVIFIKGAREHNLKNIDVEIPRNKMVIITGLSGSGKSSLAFDTIYSEGQRRYVESLSAYARQFLGQTDKPDVDYIEGLSPAISIDQKTTNKNPRSTVGTVTEIHDYLRLLYARAGVVHCTKCGKAIERQSVDQMVDAVMKKGGRIIVSAPVVRGRKGEYRKLLEQTQKAGFTRVNVDGIIYTLDEEIPLDKNKKHTIDIIVDRLIIKEGIEGRLAESIELSLNLAEGLCKIIDAEDESEELFSQNFSCPKCGVSIEEISPRMFSFNNPYGACPHCHGLGEIQQMDPDLIVPDKSLSLKDGAIRVSGWNSANEDSFGIQYLKSLAREYNFSLEKPFDKLPKDIQDLILFGTNGKKIKVEYETQSGSGSFFSAFEGIINNLERRYRETTSEMMKVGLEKYISVIPCPECLGNRLKPESLAVKIGSKNIAEVSKLSISDAISHFEKIKLNERQKQIAHQVLKGILDRLNFLRDVGLSYLTLYRASGTLSGGEAQRIRLATQIGSGLVGVVYILDEPSIGLHQKDNAKLLKTLKNLRDLGNTLIVVEHDEETILAADYVLDIGPGAGAHGGEVIACGTPKEIMENENSITGQYLSGKQTIEIPETRKAPKGYLTLTGARENNLKNIDVTFPLGVMCSICGVSGSGKSTLVNQILFRAITQRLNGSKERPGEFTDILGLNQIDKVVDIDQAPIGRTPRSNPATYTGLFSEIRDLFAATHDAKARGYKPGRFSFNVKGGRCEACSGDGIIKIEMHFFPDVYVPCEICKGKRYNRETLEVKYKGKNIAQVLDMTVEEACEFFANIPQIMSKLSVMSEVGLSYIKLGQSSTTLSGGEAQRVKLATYLSKRQTGKTLFILDEPTTGLHMADTKKLIAILRRLVDKGNSVLVIEHNLDVIKCSDHIIDLGPDGGDGGGQIIAAGTPEEIAKNKNSYTGEYLKKCLST